MTPPGVVVYGPYPPTAGPAAGATMAAVRRHLAGGAEVVVVSPRPSAAHHHADLATAAGAALLARLAAGRDLELALEPALLGAGIGREAAAQTLLALAIRRARHATVHVGPLGRATGRGRVRLILGPADAVTAASEADAEALGRAGIQPDRLSVRPPEAARPDDPTAPAAPVAPVAREPWELSDNPAREELEAAVRRRAALDRLGSAHHHQAGEEPATRL